MTQANRAAVLSALLLAGCGAAATHPARAPLRTTPARTTTARTTTARTTTTPTTTTPSGGSAIAPPRPRRPFAVSERVVTFVDHSRLVRIPGAGLRPRTLVTVIRYPRAPGRFPLVIFGHGFTVTPAIYAPLLEAWAHAGYVVAAPVFPLENANAPGGPDETDLVNQPRDMSFVITQLVRTDAHVDPRQIAVTGQSDGGETALAVAYDDQFLDRRVRAAVILSGAKIPGVGGFDFPAPSPPLLATQGTADTINPPSFTHAFFDVAPRPKYLLDLFGASHIGPYTGEQPFTRTTERVTIAFLDRYLKGQRGALTRMRAAGNVAGVSALEWYP